MQMTFEEFAAARLPSILRYATALAGSPQLAEDIVRWDDPTNPVTIEFGPAPLPVEAHAMALPGLGICSPVGHFEYLPLTDDVRLVWSDNVVAHDVGTLF
jgi:hypothetical protein